MKQLFITLFIATLLLSFKPITKNGKDKIEASAICKYGQCQATAKSTGNECNHCVSKEMRSIEIRLKKREIEKCKLNKL